MQQPLFNQHPIEMGLSGREASVVAMLSADTGYANAFRSAFPAMSSNSISIANMIGAIACYERTLISGNSPFDHYVFEGEHDAINEPTKRGMKLFYSQRLGCAKLSRCSISLARPLVVISSQQYLPLHAMVGNKPMRIPTPRNIALTSALHARRSLCNTRCSHYHYENATTMPNADKRLRKIQIENRRTTSLARISGITNR